MIEAALFCLALNLYHEARGESVDGERMVAYVTMNRANWNQARVCTTVFAEGQFSWTNQRVRKIRGGWGLDLSLRPTDKVAWKRAQAIAKTVLMVGGPAIEAVGITHYHAVRVHPYWARRFTVAARVGAHIFYR